MSHPVRVSPFARVFCVVQGELRLRVVIPLPVRVEKTAQPRDLRREEHHDDLHLDVKVQPQDLLARLEGLRACGDEHVPLKAELLEGVDHLAELGGPREDAELWKEEAHTGSGQMARGYETP